MRSAAALVVLKAAFALAQCEAPVPCTDPTLLALDTSDCQQYHIFVARGSDSGYPGHLGALIRSVCESLPDCGYENIIYPANSTMAGPTAWCKSAATGAAGSQEQLTNYAERCPNSRLIVLGFSQGGSVVLDALGGGGGPVFQCVQANNPRLDRSKAPGKNIVAAVVFGAAVRSAGQPYTVTGEGNLAGDKLNGTSPRSAEHLVGLDQYASVLRDYCNFGDPICAKGSEPEDVHQHLNYFDLYNEEAAKWVINTAQNSFGANKTTSTQTTASAHTTASAQTAAFAQTTASASPLVSAAKRLSAIDGAVDISALLFPIW